jgi:hypothetical protein
VSTPSLQITVGPVVRGTIVFQPLARRTQTNLESGQLALMFRFKNNEPVALHISELRISFEAASGIGDTIISPDIDDIPSGAEQTFNSEPGTYVILPADAPTSFKLAVSCTGFSDPVTLSLPLRAHVSPVEYHFPARVEDLRAGEYWLGSAAAHAGGFGSQMFAYDLGVYAFDSNTNTWTGNLPDTNGSMPEHSRTWGKPIHAMADGVVVDFQTGVTGTVPAGGNHFWINHGREVAAYAHLQDNSMNPDLLVVGAPVKRGQFLGLAGSSGNSTGPHLHVVVAKGHTSSPFTPVPGARSPFHHPRPLLFSGIRVIQQQGTTQLTAVNGPWVAVDGRGLPPVWSLIQPLPQPQRSLRPKPGTRREAWIGRWESQNCIVSISRSPDEFTLMKVIVESRYGRFPRTEEYSFISHPEPSDVFAVPPSDAAIDEEEALRLSIAGRGSLAPRQDPTGWTVAIPDPAKPKTSGGDVVRLQDGAMLEIFDVLLHGRAANQLQLHYFRPGAAGGVSLPIDAMLEKAVV